MTHRPFWLATLVFVSAMPACGGAVTPTVDADAAFDAQVDGTADDGVALACLPLSPCNNPRCMAPCAYCVDLRADNPEGTEARSLGSACVQLQGRPGGSFSPNGQLGCNEPEYVALVNANNNWTTHEGSCVRREQCVALYDAFVDRAQPGETPERCRFSDYTYATRDPVQPSGVCSPEDSVCGLGCPCPSGKICAFASQRVPFGVCIPPTDVGNNISRPCRAMPDRQTCPVGQACLLPLRQDTNVPDRERWGVCLSRLECEGFTGYLNTRMASGFYRCDTTLVDSRTDAGVDAR